MARASTWSRRTLGCGNETLESALGYEYENEHKGAREPALADYYWDRFFGSRATGGIRGRAAQVSFANRVRRYHDGQVRADRLVGRWFASTLTSDPPKVPRCGSASFVEEGLVRRGRAQRAIDSG